MPLISDSFDGPVNPASVPAPIQIASPAFRGITVDTRYTPRRNLISYVSGSKWLVNYYSQVLDADSGLSAHQLTKPAHVQSYKLIKQMLLRVTQGLQDVQDSVTKVMSVNGTATLVAGLVGNVGDVFLVDIGDGREGLFEVTNSEKLSIFKDAVYSIDYMLVGYSSPETVADLDAKTVETLYFRKDYLLYGQKPFIDTAEMEDLALFASESHRLATHYFSRYFNDEFQTLTLPGQSSPVYDPFLVSAVMCFFNSEAAKELLKLRVLNIGNAPVADVSTLWDAMLSPSPTHFKMIEKRVGLTDITFFSSAPLMNSIRYSGIRYVVYPTSREAPTDDSKHLNPQESAYVVKSSLATKIEDINEVRDALLTGTPTATMPVITPVLFKDSYIASPEFYQGRPQSILEACLRKHIACEPVDPIMLKVLVNTVYYWGDLEKFYYTPLLLIMLRQYAIGI